MIIDLGSHSIHAATGGVDPTPGRPWVVLVHGAGMDGTVWSLQTRYLAHRGVNPLAIDLPGHGASPGTPLESIDAIAALLVDLAGNLDGPVTIAGHSMGALAGLCAAARLGSEAHGLVLMGVAAAMQVHDQLLRDATDDLPAAAALMTAWSHGRDAHIGGNPTPGLWMTGGAQALVERSAPGVLAVDFAACAAHTTAPDDAAAVRCATTIVIGAADRMTRPAAARTLAAAFGDDVTVDLVELDGVGHSMMTEAPRPVRSAILARAR